jgi:hypothetical protein
LRAIKWTNEDGERTAESIRKALGEIDSTLLPSAQDVGS